MANKKNWDQIRNQKVTDTVKYRDVYEEQQLERGRRAHKESMLSRNILNGFICLFVFFLVWIVVSAYDWFQSGKEGIELSPDPAYTWIYVQEHYLNVNDNTDRISVGEFEEIRNEFKQNYDSSLPVVEKPEEPKNPETSGEYINDNGVWVDVAGRQVDMASLIAKYENELVIYNQELEEYNKYISSTVDPEWNEETGTGTYRYIRAHYRNRNDTSQAIEVADYEALVKEYENSELSKDLADVPGRPYNPSELYKEESLLGDDVVAEDAPVNNNNSGNQSNVCVGGFQYSVYDDYGGIYHQHYKPSGVVDSQLYDANDNPVSQADIEAMLAAGGNNTNNNTSKPIDPYKPDPNKQYRHIFDGHVISSVEYAELQNKYVQDYNAYKEAYWAHREKFHPDDIDGTKKVFSMAPTVPKVLIGLAISTLLFGILYIFFKKNLDAQNLLTDTSDINQYEDDQHIALPEEVQRNYDWFPDVGAHSAVQVSSMISHMALTNKGLKQVQLATRAEKDILDEDGDVEYYKGEILQDNDGNPITKTVPIIDEKFMDALFDASGAPKDKNVRKKYDTTKIPYNPDGSNRDKLGKYETVADLINDDWEFPLYEPQRPGGAYIVDTAPVNTMVLAIKKCIA